MQQVHRQEEDLIIPEPNAFREWELGFSCIEGIDSAFQSGARDSELSRRTWRAGDPPSALSQRRLDNLPLGPRLTINLGRRCLNLRQRSRDFFAWIQDVIDQELGA
jgi:hypothetical protein